MLSVIWKYSEHESLNKKYKSKILFKTDKITRVFYYKYTYELRESVLNVKEMTLNLSVWLILVTYLRNKKSLKIISLHRLKVSTLEN